MSEMVRLKVQVMEMIREKDISGISNLIPRLSSQLPGNFHFLDHSMIMAITKLLLIQDRQEGLKWGQQFLTTRTKTILDSETCTLVHLLLFPTILDNEALNLLPSWNKNSSSPTGSAKGQSPNQPPPSSYSPRLQSNTLRSPTVDMLNYHQIPTLGGKNLAELRRKLHSWSDMLTMIEFDL